MRQRARKTNSPVRRHEAGILRVSAAHLPDWFRKSRLLRGRPLRETTVSQDRAAAISARTPGPEERAPAARGAVAPLITWSGASSIRFGGVGPGGTKREAKDGKSQSAFWCACVWSRGILAFPTTGTDSHGEMTAHCPCKKTCYKRRKRKGRANEPHLRVDISELIHRDRCSTLPEAAGKKILLEEELRDAPNFLLFPFSCVIRGFNSTV